MGKNPDPGSGINIPDNFFESLETILRDKNIQIFWCGSGSGIRNIFDPGSGMEKFGSGMEKCGSGIKHPRFATLTVIIYT
jgi:hypothetical protein